MTWKGGQHSELCTGHVPSVRLSHIWRNDDSGGVACLLDSVPMSGRTPMPLQGKIKGGGSERPTVANEAFS